MTDAHLSAVAAWMLETVGKAIAVSTLLGILAVIVVGILSQPTRVSDWLAIIGIAGFVSTISFAAVLANSKPPTARAASATTNG